jgi:methyltransferase (TIGR00027 family)
MLRDRPSRTAMRVAQNRAAHQLLDEPLVLRDPLALQIIPAPLAADIRERSGHFRGRFVRHLRAFLVARSALAEAALAQALERGVRQYVVLGAGLDTFAYRNPYPATQLQVFEVDFPATQAWKRQRLAEAGMSIPASLTFVPVDFETQQLAARLRECGLAADTPSFFSWLGVTMYLRRATVIEVLRFVAQLPRGSGVVFDYAVPPQALSPLRRLLYHALLQRVAAVGEPWHCFFTPAELDGELAALGFGARQDLGAAELNARYFQGRQDQLRVAGPGRVMSAHT